MALDPSKGGDGSHARADLDAAIAAADDLLRANELTAAEDRLERAAREHPTEPRVAVRRLELRLRWRDYGGFDALAMGALERFPDRADLWALVARAAEERDRPCAAIRAYGRAAALDRDDLEAPQRAARMFRARGRPFLARRGLRRVLRRHPDAAPLHAAMGYCYVDDAQYGKAVGAFRLAVEHAPGYSPYLDDLAGACLLAERWRDAAAAAVKSLKTTRATERAWTAYAVAHRHLGNVPQAERGYRSAVACAVTPGRACGNLGLFLASRATDDASRDEARRRLDAALEEHPDWPEVRAAREGLGAAE